METGCHSLHKLKYRAVITLVIVFSLLFYIFLIHIHYYQRTLEIIGVLKNINPEQQQTVLYHLFTESLDIEDGKYVLMKNGYQLSGQRYLFLDLFSIIFSIGYIIFMIFILVIYRKTMKKEINRIENELDYFKTEVEHFLFQSTIKRNESYKECNYLLERLEKRVYDVSLLKKKELDQMMNFHQNIIHQINTPLNTIKILVEYLYTQGKVSENYLDDMNYAIEKASDLANIYLRSAKIGTGKVTYCFEKIILYDLIEEVIVNLKICANYFHTVLINQCDSSIIDADSLWMKEAIKNIIKNYIDNSEERKEIIISSFSTSSSVIIRIDSEGYIHGNIDDINFERFESSKSGIGIGLHFCKQIIEAHLGEIYVEKNSLGGLGFVIQLPIQLHKNKIDWRRENENNRGSSKY